MSHYSDVQLVKQCRKGSIEAQKAFYDRFSSLLRGVCRRYIACPEEAKDVFQDGMMEIYKSLNTYKHQGSLKGWVKTVMRNTAIDHIRKSKKDPMYMEQIVEVKEETSEEELYYLKLLDIPEFDRTLIAVLNKMPTILSTVFNMYYIDNMNHKEVAKKLGIEEVTSRTRLNRARNIVMKELKVLLKNEIKAHE